MTNTKKQAKKSRKPGRPRTYADGGAMIYFRMPTKRSAAQLRKLAKLKDMTVSAYVRLLVEDKLMALWNRI